MRFAIFKAFYTFVRDRVKKYSCISMFFGRYRICGQLL